MKTALSFGCGRQTMGLLVLIGEGRWPRPDAIVMADTGGEHPATYDYLHSVAEPYAKSHGMDIVTLGPEWRIPSERQTLEQYCLDHRMLPGSWARWCTHRYKIAPLTRYQREVLGAVPIAPVEVWIGISTDEARRAHLTNEPGEIKRYPLIELGISRQGCEEIITAAGLIVPPKSGCFFCPFKRRADWQALKRNAPDLFARALEMERNAEPNRKTGAIRYLPVFGPLEGIAAQDELPGFDEAMDREAECVTGACFV